MAHGYREMATAGYRHVRESYREVNDGLAVIPEAETEIGHAHIHSLTTRPHAGTHTLRRMSGK